MRTVAQLTISRKTIPKMKLKRVMSHLVRVNNLRLPLKDELSRYWFVVTHNRITTRSANKTSLLAIMCTPVRMVMNKVRKRYVLANGVGVEEAVEVNPFTAIE